MAWTLSTCWGASIHRARNTRWNRCNGTPSAAELACVRPPISSLDLPDAAKDETISPGILHSSQGQQYQISPRLKPKTDRPRQESKSFGTASRSRSPTSVGNFLDLPERRQYCTRPRSRLRPQSPHALLYPATHNPPPSPSMAKVRRTEGANCSG